MRDRLFKMTQSEVSMDEYFDVVVERQRLKNFYRQWQAPPRPDRNLQIPAYMAWLKIMSDEFVKAEGLMVANELHEYHCGNVRMELNERNQRAREVLSDHLESKANTVGLVHHAVNLSRNKRSDELQIGFFAEKAARARAADEQVRQEFNDLHRGKIVLEQRLARKR